MAPLPRDRDKLTRMEQAVRVLIQGLGEDLEREGLRDTPKRVAKALLDCTQGYHQDTASTLGTALFHEPIVHHGGEGIVVVRDIDFASISEEMLLPFHGRCHVAYRPKDGVVLGLSKLARLTKQYAKRLQTQEGLAAAIVLALQQSLECHGVAVVLQARHLSNNSAPDERISACVSGTFATMASCELEALLALLNLEDLPQEAVFSLDGSTHASAASGTVDPGVPVPVTPDPSEKETDGDSDDLLPELSSSCCEVEEMEAAVQQLLLEVGENPHRPGLVGAARRYVMSLLASTSGYHMQPPLPVVKDIARQAHPPQALPQQLLLAQHQQGGLVCGQVPDMSQGEGSSGQGAGPVTGCAFSDGAARQPRCSDMRGVSDVSSGASGCRTMWSLGRSTGRRTGALPRKEVFTAVGAVHPPTRLAFGSFTARNTSCRSPLDTLAPRGAALSCSSYVAVDAERCPGTSCCTRAGTYYGRHCEQCSPQAAGSLSNSIAAGTLCGAVTLHLSFASQCEHHMLPFYGSLMVAYIPGAARLLRAAVEQVVLMFTQRLQVQERITHQVADAVEVMLKAATVEAATAVAGSVNGVQAEIGTSGSAGEEVAETAAGSEGAAGLGELGVMVVCDAAHMCMVARGVENHSGSTTTIAVRGSFAARPELRRAVLCLFREQL